MTANIHLGPQLDAYVALKKPGFALMVDAPWGAGKTHTVKRWLVDRKHLLVSLYGATSRDDIERAIVVARLNAMENNASRAVATIVNAGLEVAASYFEVAKPKGGHKVALAMLPALIVFDDLERTEGIPVHTLLSVLNRYVEQEGRHVILLANQEELRRGCEDYDRVREKVVGRVIALEPDEIGALDAFLGELDGSKAHLFLSEQREVILSVFRTSECQNLRLLRQALLEYARFHDVVPDDLLGRSEPMQQILATFLALTITFHEGRDFGLEDLGQDSHEDYLLPRDGLEEPREVKGYSAFKERYRRSEWVRISELAISGNLAKELIGRGNTDAVTVERELRRAPLFSQSATEDWRTLWYWAVRPASEVHAALQSVRSKLAQQSVTDAGTLLHIADVLLELSEHEMIDESRDAVRQSMTDYVRVLRSQGRLHPVRPVTWSDQGFEHGSVYGLGFYQHASEDFKGIQVELMSEINAAFWDRSADLASDLLELALRQPKTFANSIGWGLQEEGITDYARVPILAKVDPSEAAQIFCSLQPEEAHTVLEPFKDRIRGLERYASERHQGDWPDERAWLVQVRDEILRIADEADDPIRSAQLRTLIKRKLGFLDPQPEEPA